MIKPAVHIQRRSVAQPTAVSVMPVTTPMPANVVPTIPPAYAPLARCVPRTTTEVGGSMPTSSKTWSRDRNVTNRIGGT